MQEHNPFYNNDADVGISPDIAENYLDNCDISDKRIENIIKELIYDANTLYTAYVALNQYMKGHISDNDLIIVYNKYKSNISSCDD